MATLFATHVQYAPSPVQTVLSAACSTRSQPSRGYTSCMRTPTDRAQYTPARQSLCRSRSRNARHITPCLRRGRTSPLQCQSERKPETATAAATAETEADTSADAEAYGKDANYDALADSIRVLSDEVREKLGGTSIYLVGMMGSGKSTVGKLLAAALSYYFFDSDSLVEQHTESSVSEIFEAEGEDAFREVETAVLQELAPFRDCVVATGGGAVTRRVNWGHMNHAVSVYLDGTAPLLAARVVADGTESRPLIAANEGDEGGDNYQRTLQRLEGMMEDRAKHYHAADMRVSLSQTPNGGDLNLSAAAAVVTYRILTQLKHRLNKKAEELEQKRTSTVTVTDIKDATSPEE